LVVNYYTEVNIDGVIIEVVEEPVVEESCRRNNFT
jgi:hypothetical protein